MDEKDRRIAELEAENAALRTRIMDFDARLIDESTAPGLDELVRDNIHGEARVAARNAALRALADTLPDVTFVVDEHGVYVDVIASADHPLAAEVGALRGRRMDEVLPPRDADIYLRAIRETLRQGTPQTVEYVAHVDGRRRRMEGRTSVLPTEPGERAMIIWVSRDITARRRAQAARRMLAKAVEHAAEGIVITGADGVVQYVNPAFERITGYDRFDIVGQRLGVLRSGHHDEAFFASMWSTISGGEVFTARFVNRRRDGELYTADQTISPVTDRRGRIVRYVAVQRDVTREIALEARLRESTKMEAIGRLAGGVAHDFNNLLTAIGSYAELAAELVGEEHEAREDLGEIGEAVERARILTGQLLAFGRRQELRPEVTDLSDVLDDLRRMLQRLIGEDIELLVEVEDGLESVLVDRGKIEQVVVNMAINARDAMPAGGRLEIRGATMVLDADRALGFGETEPGRYVGLSVSDTGCGMTREVTRRIFEPFFTTKPEGRGTGLGLSTAYGIIKQSNGFVSVQSAPGLGTSFYIFFPPIEAVPDRVGVDPSTAIVPDGSLLGDETILVVEDDEAVATLVSSVLRRNGYEVIQARDGLEALDRCVSLASPVHLLLTDVILPRLGGRQLAERMCERYPGVRVLFTSGYGDDELERRGLLGGDIDLIAKPFTPDRLVRHVRRALDERALDDLVQAAD